MSEKLDFGVLWQSEQWSDFRLVIKPRAHQEPASTSAPSDRRQTRSQTRGGSAAPSPIVPASVQGQAAQGSSSSAAAAAAATARRTTRSTAQRGTATGPDTPSGQTTGVGTPRARDGQPSQDSAGPSEQTATPLPAALGDGSIPRSALVFPVHAPVLISTSEYFKTLITNNHWSTNLGAGGQVITLEVEPDEMDAARLMLEYMYKGTLPESSTPQDLLKMIKLADQYGVNRFLTACNSALDKLPIGNLALEDAITVLSLPSFLLDSAAMATARKRAEEKLHEVFGDLESAWFDAKLRQAFLQLPYCAVKYLLGRTETAVYCENTVLVAASDWLAKRASEGSPVTSEQQDELFALVRIPFLSSSYMELLPDVGWLKGRLDSRLLIKALQYCKSEGRVHDLIVTALGPTGVPRAVPERQTLEMDWHVRKSDIQDLIAECRNEAAPVVESNRLFSDPPYYHAGFLWRMVLFVHKKREPKKRRIGAFMDVSNTEEETVFHDFVGITCRAVIGGEVHTPLVGMAVELQASRFSALGEVRQPQRTEVAGYVEDEIPYGVYDFFRVDNLTDADALNAFTCFRGHLHLTCKVTRCF